MAAVFWGSPCDAVQVYGKPRRRGMEGKDEALIFFHLGGSLGEVGGGGGSWGLAEWRWFRVHTHTPSSFKEEYILKHLSLMSGVPTLLMSACGAGCWDITDALVKYNKERVFLCLYIYVVAGKGGHRLGLRKESLWDASVLRFVSNIQQAFTMFDSSHTACLGSNMPN